jgi:glycosyltransferase involved in cell wall biosynthesis
VTRHLDFFPDWRRGNPFLSMLFSGLAAIGATPRPTGPIIEHLANAAGYADPGVLNLHWTAPVLAGAVDASDARRRAAGFRDVLADFTDAGGRLVWTVHNVLPHDATYVESEVEVCRAVAAHADVVHVLCAETPAAVAPYYTLDPARVVVVPHSSYVGYYPQEIDRSGARARLGLADDDRVLATVGLIRPYKGIDRLLDLLGDGPLDRPDLRLLVAGLQGRGPGMRDLVDRLASTPRVVVRAQWVPRRSVQVWMGAADLAVLPYIGILNSGSFLLAETFGLPVVAPRSGALVSRSSDLHVRLFDPDDFESVLVGAVEDLVDDPVAAAAARRSALAAAAANPPDLMARRFAAVVGPLLGGSG